MPIFHAIVLGITQGLSEYLPISSSGHLILVPWLFGWNDFHGSDSLEKTFDVALHLGTLAGAIMYFRSDIRRLVRAAITGALFASSIEEHTDQIWLIATMLIVGAMALAWADGALGKRTIDEVTT